MKKILTILSAVGLVATTGATVVACGTPDDKEKTELQKLEEVIAKAKSIDTEKWSFSDKTDLKVETQKALAIFEKESSTKEELNFAALQLAWQINKFQDKNNSEVSNTKKELSRSLAWATEKLNKGIKKAQEAKDKLIKEINKEIEIYNSNKEDNFDAAREVLEQATSEFISAE